MTGQTGGQGESSGLPACFLCESPTRGQDDQVYILHRARLAYVILNLYPYNTGHLMIAPYEHGGELEELAPETSEEMWTLAQLSVRILKAEYRPDGFNIGMNVGRLAGAGVPGHLHLHVVPRWGGDTNFLAVVGETRILPEDLNQTYARLRPLFDAHSPESPASQSESPARQPESPAPTRIPRVGGGSFVAV